MKKLKLFLFTSLFIIVASVSAHASKQRTVLGTGYTDDGVFYEITKVIVAEQRERADIIGTTNVFVEVTFRDVSQNYTPPRTFFYDRMIAGERHIGSIPLREHQPISQGGGRFNVQAFYSGWVDIVRP